MMNYVLALLLFMYLALIGLISANAFFVIGGPLWLSTIPLVGVLVVAAVVWRVSARGDALLRSLLLLGQVGLVVVAAMLVWPAWQVVWAGQNGIGVGHMAPMFASALTLYGANLWIESMRVRDSETGERIARFLAGPRLFPALMAAVILCSATVLALEWVSLAGLGAESVTGRVLNRGIIPPTTVLLFFWGLLLLLGKWWNVARFGRALQTGIRTHSFLARRIADFVDGRDEGSERMRYLWRSHDESYLLPRYLCWALPVLGFIGTVLGISLAAEGIRRIIASESGVTGLSADLGLAIAPLGIAFDTTLIALTLSIFLTLTLALVQKGEARALTTLERRLRSADNAF